MQLGHKVCCILHREDIDGIDGYVYRRFQFKDS